MITTEQAIKNFNEAAKIFVKKYGESMKLEKIFQEAIKAIKKPSTTK